MELESGKTYVITRDVINPKADKRHKYDPTKWPVWKKGYRINVQERTYGERMGVLIKTMEISFVEARHYSNSIDNSDERYNLLAAAAEPAEETLATLKKRLRFNYSDILEQLLIDGDISVLDIEAAYERCNERWDEEGID